MSQIPPPMGAPPMGYQQPGPSKPQGMAIGALVCGILAIVLFCFPIISIPLGIAAIVLGVMGRGKAQRGEAGGEGLAKIGMILGIVGAALSLLWMVLLMAGFRAAGSAAERMQQEAERLQREAQQQQTDDAGTATPTTTDAP